MLSLNYGNGIKKQLVQSLWQQKAVKISRCTSYLQYDDFEGRVRALKLDSRSIYNIEL